MDITEFLTACLREDKAIAERVRKAGARSWWARNVPRFDNGYPRWQVDLVLPERASPRGAADCFDEATAKHVARHDPARVLREVAAKRRVLERHHDDDGDGCYGCGFGSDEERMVKDVNDCPELRNMASIYADHPDYDPAWRVE